MYSVMNSKAPNMAYLPISEYSQRQKKKIQIPKLQFSPAVTTNILKEKLIKDI